MKAEIDLEWHIHVGSQVITAYSEPYYEYNETYYRVKDQYGSRSGFRTLEDAIEYAKKEEEENVSD